MIRYQPLTTVVSRLAAVHKQCRSLAKQCDRLQLKIAVAAQTTGITVDPDLHQDLQVHLCICMIHWLIDIMLFLIILLVNSIRK